MPDLCGNRTRGFRCRFARVRTSPRAGQVLGRLKRTTSIAQMRAELEALVAPSMARMGAKRSDWTASVTSVKEVLVGDSRQPLLILAGAVGFVLLIACSNVASLFLTRAEERAPELAVRAALGAGHGRLVRQLLTESTVMSLAGGLFGVFVTIAGIGVIARIAENADLLIVSTIRVDLVVLVFAAAVSLISGVLFGIAPVIRRQRGINELAGAGRSLTRSHERFHRSLVVTEIALSLVLLSGAGLLAKSLHRMRAIDPGFLPSHVAVLALDLPASRYQSIDDVRALQERMLVRLRAIPTIERAATSNFVPFDHNMFAGQFTLAGGRQWPQDRMAYKVFVTPTYFDVMGIRLRAGRLFTADDNKRAPAVAMVSASFAREMWPSQSPIGQRLTDTEHPAATDWLTVAGVVDDVKQSGLAENHPLAIYRPYEQATSATVTTQPSLLAATTVVLRTRSNPYKIASPVRTVVRDIDKDLSVWRLQSMDDLIAQSTASPIFQARLLATCASLGLVLTMVGIYGVLAYSVSRRTRELGLRMALGADRRRIVREVITRSALLTSIGIGAGTIVTIALSNVLRRFLFEVTPTDPSTLIGVALLIMAVSIAAAARPAIRASAVDPATALRTQ